MNSSEIDVSFMLCTINKIRLHSVGGILYILPPQTNMTLAVQFMIIIEFRLKLTHNPNEMSTADQQNGNNLDWEY